MENFLEKQKRAKKDYVKTVVFNAVILVGSLYSAFHTKMFIGFLIFFFFLLFFVLSIIASRNPGSPWVRRFYSLYGPRTDVKYMTKKELIDSGLSYLFLGLVFLAGTFLLGYFITKYFISSSILIGAIFCLVMLTLAFLCGAIYLLIRGLFRNKNYIPPGYIENFDDN